MGRLILFPFASDFQNRLNRMTNLVESEDGKVEHIHNACVARHRRFRHSLEIRRFPTRLDAAKKTVAS